jgi:hypothetical protein
MGPRNITLKTADFQFHKNKIRCGRRINPSKTEEKDCAGDSAAVEPRRMGFVCNLEVWGRNRLRKDEWLVKKTKKQIY